MTINKEEILSYLRELVNLKDHVDTEAAAESIKKNVHFRGPNVYILAFAIIVASVGLNVNSIPVIIGAMLISPLMGPIIGFGLGVGTRDMSLVWSALRNLAVMAGISILASTLYFLLTPLELLNPSELLGRTNPSIYDVFIAFFGGLAGILETSRKEKGTVMSGVAIATALMPPLCTVGYGIANGNLHHALGAFYLFFLNSIFIATAAYLTVKFLRYKTVDAETVTPKKRIYAIAIAFILLIIPSIYSAVVMVRENNFLSDANALMKEYNEIGFAPVRNTEIDPAAHTISFTLGAGNYTESEMERFYSDADKLGIKPEQIIINDRSEDYRAQVNREDMLESIIKAKEAENESLRELIKALNYRIAELEASQQMGTAPAAAADSTSL